MPEAAADGRWFEVGDGVLVRRYAELDLSVGLVLGDERCLVVDTRGDVEQGAELAAAVRAVTPLPWTVAITHGHYDHVRGTAAFLPCEVWAHAACPAALGCETWPDLVVPGHLVTARAELALGGRSVSLLAFPAAHTGHDLAVHVPDAGVVFAGDLVEHEPGGSFTAESFGPDTTLASWPTALEGLLVLDPRVVVAGHGEPVDAGFVGALREPLRTLARLREQLAAGEISLARARALSPFAADVTEAALAGATATS